MKLSTANQLPQAVIEILRQGGYRITRGKKELLSVFARVGRPLAISELTRRMARIGINQATVYRMIGAFERLGVVRRVNLGHGHADYELVGLVDHHHIVCVDCGRVADVAGCPYRELTSQVLKKAPGFERIVQHSIEFFGVCRSCAVVS